MVTYKKIEYNTVYQYEYLNMKFIVLPSFKLNSKSIDCKFDESIIKGADGGPGTTRIIAAIYQERNLVILSNVAS